MTFEYMEFYGWTEDLNDLGAEGWDAVTLNYDYPHKCITGVLKRSIEGQVVIQQGVSITGDDIGLDFASRVHDHLKGLTT